MTTGTATGTAQLRIGFDGDELLRGAEAFERFLDAARGTANAAKSLEREKAKLAKAETAVGGETRKATRAIREEGASASKTKTEVDNFAKAQERLRGDVNRLVGAFVTLEVAKKVYATVTRAASAAVTAFAEQNAQAAARLEATQRAGNDVAAALGEVAIGGERGDRVFGALQAAADRLRESIGANADTLGELVDRGFAAALDVLPTVVRAFGVLANTVNVARGVFASADLAVSLVASGFVQLGQILASAVVGAFAAVTEAAGVTLDALGRAAAAVGLDGLGGALQGAGASTDALAESSRALSSRLGELALQTGQRGVDAARRSAEAIAQIGRDMLTVDEIAGNLATALEGLGDLYREGAISAREYAEATGAVEASAKAAAAAIKAETEALAGAQAKAAEAAKSSRDYAAERAGVEAALDAQAGKAAERAQAEAAALTASIQAQKAKADADAQFLARQESLQARAQGLADGLSGAFEGLGAALVEGGSAIPKLLGQLLGDILVQVGRTQLALGAINLIPPPFNPAGNPAAGAAQIALGAAAITLGSALGAAAGGAGGGGGRSAASAPQALGSFSAPVPQQTTQVSNTTVNFGFVTDPDAAAKALVNAQDSARRLGY